ncbi:hypothetical protein CIT27_07275 [Photobacterium carnosum]|nr:hypothetical protein CIT27_07275 [Photobacterium carnosum]
MDIESMSNTDSFLTKAIETETGKYVSGLLFKKLDKLLEIRNRDVEISNALSSIIIPNDAEKRAILEEKVIDRYLKFKTINSDNVDVHIDDIYHPLKFVFCDNGQKNLVDESFTLVNRKITCVIGKAGQGKTTIIRKLVQKELNEETGRIPLIITLRDIDWDKHNNVCEIISLEFDRFGVSIPSETIIYLLQFNKLLVCFDGFDEVKDEYRKLALKAINDCYSKYDCQTIVTTRPGTEVTLSLDSSRNANLLDLTLDDIFNIIDINKNIDKKYKELLKDAAKSKEEIGSILLTPIIVDIFILVYSSLDSEPKTLAEFYGQLFSIIINKHDRFKFLTRQSKSGLTNHELHNVFCHACFHMIVLKAPLVLSEDYLRKVFSESCESLGINEHNDLSHIDIVDKTSLLKRDGDFFSFIHKTILEYHAARKISDLDSSLKTEFYELIINNYDSSFENVLSFVKDIDTPSFYKLFVSLVLKNSKIKASYDFFDDDLLYIILGYNTFEYKISSKDIHSNKFRVQTISLYESSYLEKLDMVSKIINILDYPRSNLITSKLNSIVNLSKRSLPKLVAENKVKFQLTKENIEITKKSGTTVETISIYKVKVLDLIDYMINNKQGHKKDYFSKNINAFLYKLNSDVNNYLQSSKAQSNLIKLLKK